MTREPKDETRFLEKQLRGLPYKQPQPGLLERLRSGLPRQEAAASWSLRAGLAAFAMACRRWVAAHAVLSILAACATLAAGAVAVHQYAFISEEYKKHGIEIKPDDPSIGWAVEAYRANHGGKAPEFFHQMTTPVAYLATPWLDSRICSEEEMREWEALPKWAKPPWSGSPGDYRMWESLSETERKEWLDWIFRESIRANLTYDRLSPDLRRRFLELADKASEQMMRILPDLIARKASKEEFEKTIGRVMFESMSKPKTRMFQECRKERPGFVIRRSVEMFREKHRKDPVTLGDLADEIRDTPGLLEWLGDRPLTKAELRQPSKWTKLDLNQKRYEYWEYRTTKDYRLSEIYDGYVYWWVDSYFKAFLPYYPFTPEERKQVLAIRDTTYREMKSTLKELVAKKAGRRTFQDRTAEVWNKAIDNFYKILDQARARQAKMGGKPVPPPDTGEDIGPLDLSV